jgi:large subunit ribosomal protein L21
MYAIILDGGRQFKVAEGQEVLVDYREIAKGETVTFDQVLAISNDDDVTLGQPTVEGASVSAEVLGPTQGKKLVVQKLRRRKNSRRRTGHRQLYTKLRVAKIAVTVTSSD